MVDKSTLGIILAVSLVLTLSFKDLMTIKAASSGSEENKEAAKKSAQKDESFGEPVFDQSSSSKPGPVDDDFGDSADSGRLDRDDADTEKVAKQIPKLKIKSNVQTIKFLFCFSCGYRNMYEQYAQIIRQRYPDLNIVGENYTPSPIRTMTAQFLGTFKLVLIGLIIFGQNPFPYLNMNTPNVFTWAVENKLYASLMIFFLSNAIETQLISTGAFEIYLNDIPIWSKLQSDRVPHEKELVQILDMNFNFDSAKRDAFGSGAASFNPDMKF